MKGNSLSERTKLFYRWSILLFSLVCVYVINAAHGLREGHPCIRSTDNATGTCRLLNDCPEIRETSSGRIPDLCEIRGVLTFVCCVPKEPLNPNAVAALSLNSETSNQIHHSVPISQRKCKEYAKLAYEKVSEKDNTERDRCVRPADSTKPGAALLGEFPFMALLSYINDQGEKSYVCGGVLISERYVLTSAVCAVASTDIASKSRNFAVTLGDLIVDDDSDGAPAQEILVAQTIVHPDYDPAYNYHDIALLLLQHEGNLSHFVRPACLPHGDSLTAESFVAPGWGAVTQDLTQSTKRLLKVTLVLAPFTICDTIFPPDSRYPFGIYRPTQLCAGHPNKKNGVCNGDGGGPLLAKSSSGYCSYDVVGIVSFGKECGVHPDVFTRVAYYVRWIENIIWT